MRQGLLDSAVLPFSRPTQVSPTEKTLAVATGVETKFSDGEDAIVHGAAAQRTVQTIIRGGHDVALLGGKYVSAPGGGGSLIDIRAVGTPEHPSNNPGSIWIEGADIDGSLFEVDGLLCGGNGATPWSRRPDVYIVNSRFHGINGSSEKVHADCIQPQASFRNLKIWNCTFKSNCQGLFLRPELETPQTSIWMDRVNFEYEPGGDEFTYLFWLASGSEKPCPTYLGPNVWFNPRAGQDIEDYGIWPKDGQKNSAGEEIGAFSNDGGATVEYRAPQLVTGAFRRGVPPRGDFCKEADCGIGYVSPW
jgi:hypothetical protein